MVSSWDKNRRDYMYFIGPKFGSNVVATQKTIQKINYAVLTGNIQVDLYTPFPNKSKMFKRQLVCNKKIYDICLDSFFKFNSSS